MSVAKDTRASAQKIAESIATLPPLPETAHEILACFGDEFIDADKVTAIVAGDPGISARLLGPRRFGISGKCRTTIRR